MSSTEKPMKKNYVSESLGSSSYLSGLSYLHLLRLGCLFEVSIANLGRVPSTLYDGMVWLQRSRHLGRNKDEGVLYG
jgi:hypothetical protein